MYKKALSRVGNTDFLDRCICRQQDKCIKPLICTVLTWWGLERLTLNVS
jgi:hypothetical protein